MVIDKQMSYVYIIGDMKSIINILTKELENDKNSGI